MIIVTTDGAIEVWTDTTTSLDRVIVASKDPKVLLGIVTSIELAGVSEDSTAFPTRSHIQHNQEEDYYLLPMTRTTFKLWHNFEVDGYLKYGKDEFETAIPTFEHRTQVEEIRKIIYEK